MRGVRVAIAAVVVVMTIGAAASADNKDLARARKFVDASDYANARVPLDKAMVAGDASPEDLAEIHRLTGIVEGALDNVEASRLAFKRLLAMSPKATLPAGTSPK